MYSRKEIVDLALDITRQNRSQIGDLVNNFVNMTLAEINHPGWAFRNYKDHKWSWLRQKTTFATVASTEDYVLGREIDRIALIRQTESPVKLIQLRDEDFFERVPDPTDTGNPRFYRLWETEGVSTRLATADTIDVVSDSASDAGSSELTVTVAGYDSNGIWQTETYALNGTSTVSGSKTFAAREIFVSKQKQTTGKITVKENSGATTLVILGRDDRMPRFKVATLYPKPSSAITMYLEYYTRIAPLYNDSDVPNIDSYWHWVVVHGVVQKIYKYLDKDTQQATSFENYRNGVKGMVSADLAETDIIDHLSPKDDTRLPIFGVRRSENQIS